jgi:hypothetical protein
VKTGSIALLNHAEGAEDEDSLVKEQGYLLLLLHEKYNTTLGLIRARTCSVMFGYKVDSAKEIAGRLVVLE